MDTWSVFSGSDIALALLGASGFFAMVAVIGTASSRVNQRELSLKPDGTSESAAPD